MDELLNNLAQEAEKSFSSKVDFSSESPLAKACDNIHKYLESFKIGPKVLMLLAVFGFPEEKRERLWQELNKVVRENN